jgi:hypothetical protein
VPPGLQDMIDAMRGRPAYVKDARWQILAWNAAARFVFGDFARIPAARRNSLRLAFVDSPFRRTMTHWDEDARRIVARFRADYARHADDPGLRKLVATLERTSAEFRRLWGQYEVLDHGNGARAVTVPGIGVMQFGYMVLRLEGLQKLTIMAYSPDPGDPNRARFVKACG